MALFAHRLTYQNHLMVRKVFFPINTHSIKTGNWNALCLDKPEYKEVGPGFRVSQTLFSGERKKVRTTCKVLYLPVISSMAVKNPPLKPPFIEDFHGFSRQPCWIIRGYPTLGRLWCIQCGALLPAGQRSLACIDAAVCGWCDDTRGLNFRNARKAGF